MKKSDLVDRILAVPIEGQRRLIALAGPPASGKSTLAAALVEQHPNWRVVPMDGFHLDNRILDVRGLRARKGAPETFDVEGFTQLIRRLKKEEEVYFPLFDRSLDCSINAAGVVEASVDTVIVEGNYLLLEQRSWIDLSAFWDFSISLKVSDDVIENRLLQRWTDQGFTSSAALERAQLNDIPNARLVSGCSAPADIIIEEGSQMWN